MVKRQKLRNFLYEEMEYLASVVGDDDQPQGKEKARSELEDILIDPCGHQIEDQLKDNGYSLKDALVELREMP